MATLGDNAAQLPIKLLVMAHSGFGKTGGLASLAAAGYDLHIADFDNGTEVLLGYLAKEHWPKVEVETFTDKFKIIGDTAVPLTALAWQSGIQKIDKWANLHKTTKSIIVIDSLTLLAKAAMRHILYMNKRLNDSPYQSDYGEAQNLVDGLLQFLYSKDVTCNILVNAHVSYIGGPDPNKKPGESKPDTVETVKPLQGLPTTIGSALSPAVPRYFNNLVVGKVLGEGAAAQRVFYTNPIDLVPAKTSVKLKSQYPIGTGLADIFRELRPQQASAQAGGNP